MRRLPAVAALSLAGLAALSACNTKTATPPSAAPSPSIEISWETLRARPLNLPAVDRGQPCPVSPSIRPLEDSRVMRGAGPVYNVATPVRAGTVDKVLWHASSSYIGPILVRGRQLDGRNQLLFWRPDPAPEPLAQTLTFRYPNGNEQPLYSEMDLTKTGTPTVLGPGWRSWPSSTYAPTKGCYAWQVDGGGFTQVIVFEAT